MYTCPPFMNAIPLSPPVMTTSPPSDATAVAASCPFNMKLPAEPVESTIPIVYMPPDDDGSPKRTSDLKCVVPSTTKLVAMSTSPWRYDAPATVSVSSVPTVVNELVSLVVVSTVPVSFGKVIRWFVVGSGKCSVSPMGSLFPSPSESVLPMVPKSMSCETMWPWMLIRSDCSSPRITLPRASKFATVASDDVVITVPVSSGNVIVLSVVRVGKEKVIWLPSPASPSKLTGFTPAIVPWRTKVSARLSPRVTLPVRFVFPCTSSDPAVT